MDAAEELEEKIETTEEERMDEKKIDVEKQKEEEKEKEKEKEREKESERQGTRKDQEDNLQGIIGSMKETGLLEQNPPLEKFLLLVQEKLAVLERRDAFFMKLFSNTYSFNPLNSVVRFLFLFFLA